MKMNQNKQTKMETSIMFAVFEMRKNLKFLKIKSAI